MSVGKSKIKKINSYDVLDYEELEKYLSEMALEGWMISDIGNVFITFEKCDSRVVKFFVDITDKKIQGDNYLSSKEYKESLKEQNLEYICGNDKFQIFTNTGRTIEVNKNKLKFTRVFKDEFGMIISFAIALLPFLFSNSAFFQSFKFYISSNVLIIWLITAVLFVVSNLILLVLKLIKYKKIVKLDKVAFNEVGSYRGRNNFKKNIMIGSTVFLAISVIILFSSEMDGTHAVPEDKLPLKLEDLNFEISDVRECDKFSNSSYFAKYSEYNDSTYDEKVSDVYDEDSDSFYKEYIDENYKYLSYSVFESKYDKILEKALQSYLNKYGLKYVKSESPEEAKKWGAKEVYSCDYLYEKIVVYDDVIIAVGSEREFNENDIKVIKTKLLKGAY